MTHVNNELLLQWLDSQGDGALALLVGKTGLSFHTLDKMIRGKYMSRPSRATRRAICVVTGLDGDLLFPAKKDKAS